MNTSTRKATRSRFKHRRYGVYDLTYEEAPPPSLALRVDSLMDWVQALCEEIPYVRRLFVDTIRLALVEFVTYVVTAMWLGTYLAINLYWLSIFLDRLRDGFIGGASPVAASWISCAVINVIVKRVHARSLETLTKRLGAHFVPQLIHASLKVDLLSVKDLHTVFPVEGRFGAEFPGGPFLSRLSWHVQSALDLTCQVFVSVYAVSRKCSPEREVLLCFFLARGLVFWLAPSNGIGCSGYIYWPSNRHFQRMKTLFGLAFSTQYRTDLLLDGIASSIETEYKKSAEQIGDAEVLDPTPWCVGMSRDWYWDVLMDITSSLPMAVYALLLPAYLSPSTIASMAFLQQANRSISLTLGRYTGDQLSFLDVCCQARRLYDAIDYKSTMPRGTEPFPPPVDTCSDAGVKISFRQVSLQYPGSDHHALHDVSFDIFPGELVLVVGTNGSGKSSLLKLLARLFDPTLGEILVDDLPLVRYDVDQLRSAVAFQSQSPVVYPMSVKENITFSLPTPDVKQEDVEEAARMGGCVEWISRLGDGYSTQLQPSFDVDNWLDAYGYTSKALLEELARHKGHPASISGGEKQRLATARTFMRINHRATRLIVVDEATSALDPVAERVFLNRLRDARAGKTIVLVTHRFHYLAHEADRILCMKDGCVVESGTHFELVGANRVYASLYDAQVG